MTKKGRQGKKRKKGLYLQRLGIPAKLKVISIINCREDLI